MIAPFDVFVSMIDMHASAAALGEFHDSNFTSDTVPITNNLCKVGSLPASYASKTERKNTRNSIVVIMSCLPSF